MAHFAKIKEEKFPLGRSNTSVFTRTEEMNALAASGVSEASRVVTRRHSLKQLGYSVLIFIDTSKTKIKIRYQRGLATVAAARGGSVGTAGKVRFAQKLQ